MLLSANCQLEFLGCSLIRYSGSGQLNGPELKFNGRHDPVMQSMLVCCGNVVVIIYLNPALLILLIADLIA
jgi:hypothetical protein